MPTRRSEFLQTVRAQYLGQRMRDLRDARGWTLKYAAEYISVEFSTLARYERAEWPFRREHVIALLDVYNVYDEGERTELVRMAEHAWRAGHWYRDDVNTDALTGPMPDRWWVHDRAAHIHVYSPLIMPELLQNNAYRDEIIDRSRLSKPLPQQERKKRTYQISQRVDALHQHSDKPSAVLAVIEESVLRRPIAGTEALKAQLEYLVDMARRLPKLDIYVIPHNTKAHPGLFGGFTVYDIQPPYPPVVWREDWDGGVLKEGPPAERYRELFEHLSKDLALGPVESIAMINTIKEEL